MKLTKKFRDGLPNSLDRESEYRKRILEFWMEHNKSKIYSLKLDKLFIATVRDLSKKPTIGRKNEFENVRVKIVRE